jgi:endonuclease/exonuclease/phosphatase family metal-dependent hydrolase
MPTPGPKLRPHGPRRAGQILAGAAILAAAWTLGGVRTAAAAPGTLKLATWNLEWFLTPETFHQLKGHCTRDDEAHRHDPRSIPCDVAANLERSASDIGAVAAYARRLDADVVALEEVDGPDAARQLFHQYDFCFTGGPVIQNTGFAIRHGLPHRCGPDVLGLSLGDELRRGATVTLYPGTRHELQLLAVHLKSGCPHQPLGSHARACERLAQQLPTLRAWVRAQRQGDHRFAMLGDFNRDLRAEHGAGVWTQLSAADADPGLVNTAAGESFRNCYIGQTHTGYIDYILLGSTLAPSLVRGSFERLTYSAADAWHTKLSDHCPVAVRLRLD